MFWRRRGAHHGGVDVTITFDELDPPAGALRVPGGDDVPFRGRMSLLQAVELVLTSAGSVATAVLASGDHGR
jgi:hypothetical protein